MKVTREKAAENRAKLVEAAALLFRQRGIDGVGVADICETAGLTHGALYGQFSSKEDLAAEAFAEAFRRGYPIIKKAGRTKAASFDDYIDFLVSPQRRDNLAGCPLTASASEVGRKDERLSASFCDGFENLVAMIEAVVDPNFSASARRERALAVIAAEIGAIAVARATAKARPDLSNDVLAATRRVLKGIGRAPRASGKTRQKRK